MTHPTRGGSGVQDSPIIYHPEVEEVVGEAVEEEEEVVGGEAVEVEEEAAIPEIKMIEVLDKS